MAEHALGQGRAGVAWRAPAPAHRASARHFAPRIPFRAAVPLPILASLPRDFSPLSLSLSLSLPLSLSLDATSLSILSISLTVTHISLPRSHTLPFSVLCAREQGLKRQAAARDLTVRAPNGAAPRRAQPRRALALAVPRESLSSRVGGAVLPDADAKPCGEPRTVRVSRRAGPRRWKQGGCGSSSCRARRARALRRVGCGWSGVCEQNLLLFLLRSMSHSTTGMLFSGSVPHPNWCGRPPTQGGSCCGGKESQIRDTETGLCRPRGSRAFFVVAVISSPWPATGTQ